MIKFARGANIISLAEERALRERKVCPETRQICSGAGKWKIFCLDLKNTFWKRVVDIRLRNVQCSNTH